MKRTNLIFNIVLSVAVVALFVLFFTKKNDSVGEQVNNTASVPEGGLKIAYVQIDSLLINLKMAQDMNADFVTKRTEYEQEYGVKRQKFEQEAAEFQQKLQRGGFLTEQSAMNERNRIMGQSEEIQKLDYELSNKLAKMEAEMNQTITEKIMEFINKYNEIANYNYIFSNTGDIIIGDQGFNITNDVLVGLNSEYDATK